MLPEPSRRRSPTLGLLLGLFITLAAVVAYSWYITRQISGLRALQTDLTDRNRKDTLLLLRIQGNLHLVALAMRDMLDNEQHYPLTAWSTQFDRIRRDLDDALRREEQVAVPGPTPDQRRYLQQSVTQFWDAAIRMFGLAREGHEDAARAQIQLSLQERQASLSNAVSRLLVENNQSEDQTAQHVQEIYAQVQRHVYWFLGATLIAISLTSLALIRANRRLFGDLAVLSDRRRQLAQQLMTTRESTLREIARELHDQFGQMVTAMGSMIGRARTQVPEGSTLHAELGEVGEIAEATLNDMRRLSQTLHPSTLDHAGLDDALEWYVSGAGRQIGIVVSYERSGVPVLVESATAIHVYRIAQEALSNVARHAESGQAWVRLSFLPGLMELDVEDHGRGLGSSTDRRGLGIVTMRERAGLVGGVIEFLTPPGGGTLVRLRVPLEGSASTERSWVARSAAQPITR